MNAAHFCGGKKNIIWFFRLQKNHLLLLVSQDQAQQRSLRQICVTFCLKLSNNCASNHSPMPATYILLAFP